MRIITVTFSRKFNLGNYETLGASMEAEISDVDNPQETLTILRDNVEMWFRDQQKKPVGEQQNQPVEPKQPKPQPEKKAEPKIDVTGLKWEEIKTENPFEVCKDYEAEAYKLLKAKIAEKQGKPIWLDNYTFWIMRDGTTLARRKK